MTAAVIENSPLLGRCFKRFLAEVGVESRTYRLWRGEKPPYRGEFDALLLTGDLHNITDGLRGYHRFEMELLNRFAGRRVFASCFAHQLVALMHGGRVARREKRLLRWEEIRLLAGHEAFGEIRGFSAPCLNAEEVAEVPAGARLLGSSENCRCQVLAYGQDIITCQAHPELTGSRLALPAAVVLLSGHPGPVGFRSFRPPEGVVSGEAFMFAVARWLAGGPAVRPEG